MEPVLLKLCCAAQSDSLFSDLTHFAAPTGGTMAETQNVIPVAGPWITEREEAYAAEAARTAWFSNHYAFNRRFEELFAERVGVKHAISLPHCTAALHLALAASGIGPGDEVIVPDVTWIASVAPVTYVGATPIFVDIDPLTWCIDPKAAETAITPKTKAIIAVDLYGSMADYAALEAMADRHGLALIEDAAEALGSSRNGRAAGAHGVAGAFSFHGSKTIATGEGGMLVTGDDQIHERATILRDHGRKPGSVDFLNDEIGFKYKMSALQAAVGLAQTERWDELVSYKRQIFSWYAERLGDRPGIALNAEPEGIVNSYWMVTAVIDPAFGIDKFALMAAMKARGIDTRPFFSPLSRLSAFDAYPESKRFLPPEPEGHAVARTGINLPSGYHVTEEKAERVSNALLEVLGEGRVRCAS